MKSLVDEEGLIQIINEPTREGHLLALCLTDIDTCKGRAGAYISDHRILHIQLPIVMPVTSAFQRQVWHYRGARWQIMRRTLLNHSWHQLSMGTVDDASDFLISYCYDLACRYIPQTTLTERRSTVPWMTSTCEQAIAKKNTMEGTNQYDEARTRCARILQSAYRQYVDRLKQELGNLRKGD